MLTHKPLCPYTIRNAIHNASHRPEAATILDSMHGWTAREVALLHKASPKVIQMLSPSNLVSEERHTEDSDKDGGGDATSSAACSIM